ncbi:hypothetical protein BaRGS_00026237 [Batillaria attramentaria]|uniref:Uncharacterized protein n=1 Tax=Batillaria attramentaria TaxID=370345 RepID=A0ABD0K597_9CAEN
MFLKPPRVKGNGARNCSTSHKLDKFSPLVFFPPPPLLKSSVLQVTVSAVLQFSRVAMTNANSNDHHFLASLPSPHNYLPCTAIASLAVCWPRFPLHVQQGIRLDLCSYTSDIQKPDLESSVAADTPHILAQSLTCFIGVHFCVLKTKDAPHTVSKRVACIPACLHRGTGGETE